MNKVALAILSLLSRGPLSGYDLKQLMNDRITPFLKVSNNQIYPQMTKLEDAGLIKLYAITQVAHHPEKKTYEITAAGVKQLQTIATEKLGDPVTQDGFQLKMYNAWLLSETDFLEQVSNEKKRHQEKARLLKQRLTNLANESVSSSGDRTNRKQHFSSWAMLKYGLTFEEMYINWCDTLTSEYKRQH